MIPKELADQVRSQVERLKGVQEEFLQTYKQLCDHYGGPGLHKKRIDVVFHQVREAISPIMDEARMDAKEVQALCSWAERLVVHR